jgi:K+-transporting ATPase ATPase C chain
MVRQRRADYIRQNHLAADCLVPADAVTASASGLDPHISVDNAKIQARRVANVRGISLDQVSKLIARFTEGPDLGILGDAGVNVLKLNVALDNGR